MIYKIKKYISIFIETLFTQSTITTDPKKISSGKYYQSDLDLDLDKDSTVISPSKDFYFSNKWNLSNQEKIVSYDHKYILENLNNILVQEKQTFLVVPLENRIHIYFFNYTTLIKVF